MHSQSRTETGCRIAAGLAIVLLLVGSWFCLAESHDGDHAMPHDICAGTIAVAASELAAIGLVPMGTLRPGLADLLPVRVVATLDPPPKPSRSPVA
jgi:uncharacterized membrane protein YccF (DUF307 family)